MADLNWLYSSIVQSSAALVAILGGFITASILNRLSNIGDLESQLEVLKRRNALAKSQRDDRFREWSLARIEDAIDDAADEFLTDGHLALDYGAARTTINLPNDIPDNLFEPKWDIYKDEIKSWIEKLNSMGAEEQPHPSESFEDWTDRNRIDVDGRTYSILQVIVAWVQQRRRQKR